MKVSSAKGGNLLRSLTMMIVSAMCVAGASEGARADTVTSHGISTFGELKYPADYPHLDYVNQDAREGGEISVWSFGSVDSMTPYTL